MQDLFGDLLHAALIVVVDGIGDDLYVVRLRVSQHVGADMPPDIALFGHIEQKIILDRAHALIQQAQHVLRRHLPHIARHIVGVQQRAHTPYKIIDRADLRAEQRAAAGAGVLRQVQLIRRHDALVLLYAGALQRVILCQPLLVRLLPPPPLAQHDPLMPQSRQRAEDQNREDQDRQLIAFCMLHGSRGDQQSMQDQS